MKRTAIYIRVSTDRQAKEGDSVPAQREALKKYIDDHPDMALFSEYLDDGISGTKFSERDELQRLLQDVSEHKIDVVLFTKMDRWFRSIRHYTATQEVLDSYGVTWTAIWEPVYDTSTPAGRLIVNQMMSIAQFEAENTSQRIRQVFEYKKKRGEVISGSVPLGYKIVNKHLVQVPEQVPAVQYAFKTYNETSNMSETLRRMVGTGAPTEMESLKRLLRNEIYIGIHNGRDDYCEPIVSKELFYNVQRLMKINYKYGKNKHEYIFSGLICCGDCGCKMSGLQTAHHTSRYRCNMYWRRTGRCNNKSGISEVMLEEYLLTHLRDLIGDELRPRDYELEEKEVKDNADRIAALTRKRDRLKDLYINELITLDEYRQDLERYNADIDALQAEQIAPRNTSALKAVLSLDIEHIYGTLTKAEKRRFWRGFVDHITFNGWDDIKVYFL